MNLRLLQAGNEIEIVARCLLFLLEIHHGPIASSGVLEPVLSDLDKNLRAQVKYPNKLLLVLSPIY